MSRKHYEAMARALLYIRPWLSGVKTAKHRGAVLQWQADVKAVADVFAADNGRFDRGRFYTACGMDGDR